MLLQLAKNRFKKKLKKANYLGKKKEYMLKYAKGKTKTSETTELPKSQLKNYK